MTGNVVKRKEAESPDDPRRVSSSDNAIREGVGATDGSRRNFLKIGAGVAGGVLVAGTIGYFAKDSLMQAAGQTNSSSTGSSSTITSSLSTSSSATSTSPSSSSSTSSGATTTSSSSSASTGTTSANQQNAFLTLSTTEIAELGAIIDTLIPTDSNGPGGTSAGAIYFIDRQLATDYGQNSNMYNKGPFVPAGLTGPITVGTLTYPGGSMITIPTAGTQYQYGMYLRDFWRYGLEAFETYCNSTYGGNFENLSSIQQVQALTDLYDNKPTNFNDIVPSDFFQEVFMMAWCGFLMDPLYGGNQGLVGWELVAFNGVNMGDFYGEGYTTQELMVATTPTRLKPASLAQFQQAAGLGSTSSSSSSTTTSSSSSSLVSSSTSSSLSSSSTTASSSSSSSSSSGSSSSSSSSGAVTIPQGAGSGLNFSPANITVAPGTTITWTDDDTVAPHNVHFLTGPTGATLPAVSPTLVKGDTFSVTLTTPGSYTYQCDFHATWMQGTVTVS